MDIFMILFLVVSKLQIIVTDGSKWSSSPKRKCSSYCQVCREMSLWRHVPFVDGYLHFIYIIID